MELVAKTFVGLEDVLAKEIAQLGGTDIEIGTRAVSFNGDLRTLYQVNLHSRVALRVLTPIYKFRAHNETVFYKRMRRFDWTKLFTLEQTFKINATVSGDYFTHSKYIGLKTKDAICDLFRLKHEQQRPNISLEEPDFLIDVHCRGRDITVSLDSSGDSLHKRGYRQSRRHAPLNEVLAAGMLMLSSWNGSTPLYDPMCGSGTILTEAYMIARNIPPRYARKNFGFMNWGDYDETLWTQVVKESENHQRPLIASISGSDIESDQIRDTQLLIDQLGWDEITLQTQDFFNSEKPNESGTIIINPPYGIRVGEEESMIEFYKSIGDTFKQKYQGWTAWVLSGNKTAIKRLGLRTSKKLTLFNGSLECKYHKYDLY